MSANHTVQITIRAQDLSSPQIKQLEQALRGLIATTGQAGQQSQQAAGGFKAFSARATEIQASTNAAQASASAMGNAVADAGTKAADAGNKAAGAGKNAGLLNTALGDVNAKSLLAGAGLAGLGVQAIEMGKAAIGAAIDWESAFAGVAKTVDATDAELDVLEQGIRDLATTMPIAATELAGIAEAAGALGVAKGDILAFTETAALIGTTTDVSSDQAATALGQLSNVIGLTADEYDNFAAALVAAGNEGASTESQILGIATRAGAAGDLLGFAADETLGWSAALANLGIEEEAAGSSLQTFLISTAKFVADAGEELDVLAETAGMTAEAFQQAFAADSSAALQTFIAGLGQLDQASQLAVLSALGFNDVRISRSLLGLASNTDNLNDSLAVTSKGYEDANAHLIEADKRFGTNASKIEIAKNRLNEYNLTLAEGYLPAIGAAIDASDPFLETLIQSAEVYGELAPMIRDVNSALNDYLPAIGGAGDGSVSLAEGFAGVMTSIIPGVSTIKTLTGAWALFNDETAESTELTNEQAAVLNAWVAEIEGAIPGIQSEAEWTARLADNQALLSSASRETMAAHVELTGATLATAEGQRAMTEEGHRGIQMAAELGVAVDDLDRTMQDLNTEAVDPLTEALDGLAGAYQEALDVMGAFNSQASEFGGISDTITKAYEEIQAKQEAGIDLTDKEIMFLEDHEEALGRLEGGQRDATIEAGFAALAAVELMEAQDALNQAIEDGVTDLTPYKDAVAQAEEKLGVMGSTTGETQDAQTALKDTIQGPLIGAIQALTRELEYVSKPWLIEIDAATAAAEAEIARIKGIISAGATLPVTVEVSGGDVGGIVNHARGTGPHGTPRDMLSWVGEEGPELAWLPQGTHVLPADESKRFAALMGTIPGFADGTGGSLPASGGSASAGSLPGSPPAPPHGGSLGLDWEAIAQAEAEAWVDLFGDAVDAAFSDNPLGFAENVQDEINDLQTKIDLAPALGVPAAVVAGWEDELAGLKGEQDTFWASFAQGVAAGLVDPAVLEQLDAAGLAQLEAYLEPIVGEEGAEKIIGGIGAVAQLSVEQLQQAFASGKVDATQFVDDIIMAVQKGQLPMADAMTLLADIPQDRLIPVLQQLTEQFGEDWTAALFAGEQAAAGAAQGGLAILDQVMQALGIDLAVVNTELGNLLGFSEDFASLGSGGVGVITSGGGGSGGSSGGGGAGSSSGASADLFDSNALLQDPPDGALSYFADRRQWLHRLGSPGAEQYLAGADAKGVNHFLYNPAGGGDDTMGISFDAAADLLLGTGRMRQFAAFAMGGFSDGPMLGILGDNPSGQELILPSERAGQFGAAMFEGGANFLNDLITTAVRAAFQEQPAARSASGTTNVYVQIDGRDVAHHMRIYEQQEMWSLLP